MWTYLRPFCYLSDRACKHKQDLLSTSALSKSSIGVFFSWLLQLLLEDFMHVLQYKIRKIQLTRDDTTLQNIIKLWVHIHMLEAHKSKYVSVCLCKRERICLKKWDWLLKCCEMINQVLCFPDGNSVVPFSQISYLSLSYQLALVLTLPKYLCRTQQRLKTHRSRHKSLLLDWSHRELGFNQVVIY